MFTGKPTGNRHLGRPRRRWEDNAEIDLKELGISTSDWVDSAQNKCYWKSPCECGIEPSGFISHGVIYFTVKILRYENNP